MRQHQWGAVLLVALPDRPGMLHLLGQFGEQTGRQRHNPVVPAFGPPDAEAASFEVYVFDTRIERLLNPHAAAVKQPCDQVGRVAALVLDGLKKQLRFGDRWCMARMNRPLSRTHAIVLGDRARLGRSHAAPSPAGPDRRGVTKWCVIAAAPKSGWRGRQPPRPRRARSLATASLRLSTERVDVANRLPQEITVKEEYGVQSLVLRAGRDITVARQARERQD